MTPVADKREPLSRWIIAVALATLVVPKVWPAQPLFESELIFRPEHWHNHASCVVELSDGSLLACWYHGSGERTANDVVVQGARKLPGATNWSDRFLLADTPDYPDANPAMVIDPEQRLWLIWPTILDNHWESALLKYRISTNYLQAGPPVWTEPTVLHVTPGDDFAVAAAGFVKALEEKLTPTEAESERVRLYLRAVQERSTSKLSQRLGWMPRAHPFVLGGRRLIVPLYSDGFSFSLMVYTDDGGITWRTSSPLTGPGNVQPSIVQRRDGSLYALMRDNGPPPKRLLQSDSVDHGQTWTPVTDSDIPNPGSGLEIISLKDGKWVLINNDTERGRHRLVVQVSEDEGRTWKWKRYLENDAPGPEAGSYSYPSLIEARDGTLHATYSYHLNRTDLPPDAEGLAARKSIKHAHFDLDWVRAAPPVPLAPSP